MPRYFFHMIEGDDFVEDPEGMELPDIASVHEEAIQAAREILASKVRTGQIIDGQQFLIVDEDGRQITTIPFKAALHFE